MRRTIGAAHLLLPDGWASPGHLVADEGGTIVAAGAGLPDACDVLLDGFVVPGLANLHSHAHHRGLVGHADQLRPGAAATLWSWREVMYRHLLGLQPEQLEAYALLAYVEMLKRGYTSVGEFHYVHHAPDGARYADLAELSGRIVAAAEAAGIALTLLPALYTSGGVGLPPEPEQRRFTCSLDEYLDLVAALDALAADRPWLRVGVAPHSLRAVRPAELAELLGARPAGPVHIHAAERTEEVEEVQAGLGTRPVEWLLANGVDERWCVIHATHMTAAERDGLAASGAVAGLCPLTEANLGDGRFDLAPYRHAGGRFGVGTDANHLIDLPGELRTLEYGQRLALHRRETLLAEGERSVGAVLHAAAGHGGAQALAQPAYGFAPGARCDVVELDRDHPALVGQTPETVLDAWVFSSASDTLVRTVMVGGRTVVSDRRHPLEDVARARVGAVMRARHAVNARA
ncbi:MAG TPA: formimidoylglutamate deiminase [Solirubrobacter sp.]|nr:formimidoylglutamate deiminase [Solirubrobacter sp.]